MSPAEDSRLDPLVNSIEPPVFDDSPTDNTTLPDDPALADPLENITAPDSAPSELRASTSPLEKEPTPLVN
jgi:hypothetical protein